jgi:hypothetical protein
MHENKKIMKRLFLNNAHKITFTCMLVFFTIPFVVAQGPGDPGDPNPDAGVPLDGGVTLLLVMAACYIIYKVWQHRKMAKLSPTDIS